MMVHLPGPTVSPTRELKQALEHLLEDHPNAGVPEIRSLHPGIQAVSDRVLEELIDQIRKPDRGSHRPLTTIG